MKTYNITVTENKDIFCDEAIVVNQMENGTTSFSFTIPTFCHDCGNIAVLETPDNQKKTYPIIKNEIIIDSFVSSRIGTWKLLFYSLNDDDVFVSNILKFKVFNNYLNKEETTEETSEQIKETYAKIQELLNKLNDTKLNEINNVLTSLEEIKEAINNIQGGSGGGSVTLPDELISKIDTILSNSESLLEFNEIDHNNIQDTKDNTELISYCLTNDIQPSLERLNNVHFTDIQNNTSDTYIYVKEQSAAISELKALLTDVNTLADNILE